MSPCLVQQLFRQKIGEELDQHIVEEVLFPMLRCKKHPSKELLQDIKLTQSCNEYGGSAIVGRRQYVGGRARHKNISPFAESCLMRRQRRTDMWGSIDILNELRSLKQPMFGKHRQTEATLAARKLVPGDEFGGIYILLEEVDPRSCRLGLRLRLRDTCARCDLNYINDYLDDALNTGKCISWGVADGRKILSTYY